MNYTLLSSLCNPLRIAHSTICKRLFRRMVPNPGKPPNLPPSKQMLYRVVDADWMEPEYVEQLLWRRHVYNNAVVALRERFRAEIAKRENEAAGIEEMKRQELDELEELLVLNEKRNAKAAREREVREKEEMEKLKADTLTEISELLKRRDEDVKLKNEEVNNVIEASKNFITAESLRKRIVEALEQPTVFDYAIDLNGKRLYMKEPIKYLEGQPTRQKSRLYDRTHSQTLNITPKSKAKAA